MSDGPVVAVVTIVHGRAAHLARQRDLLARRSPRPLVHVVVAMADAAVAQQVCTEQTGVRTDVVAVNADPARLPLAAARNAGAAAALAAGATLLVFLDVDCLPGPDLLAGYARAAVARPDALLSGPVGYLPEPPAGGYPAGDDALQTLAVPSPIRPNPPAGTLVAAAGPELFWSLSFAVGAETWRRTGGFCEMYEGYGAEDTDFALAAADRGVGLVWVGGAWAWHQNHGPSGAVQAHAADIVRNARVFHRRWGWWPMQGWLDSLVAAGIVSRDPDGTPHHLG